MCILVYYGNKRQYHNTTISKDYQSTEGRNAEMFYIGIKY